MKNDAFEWTNRRKRLLLLSLCALLMFLEACSVYKAATRPHPSDISQIKTNETRREDVIAALGDPQTSGMDPDGTRVDIFSFYEGKEPSLKDAAFYLLLDTLYGPLGEVLTLGLESGSSRQVTAEIRFDSTGVVHKVTVLTPPRTQTFSPPMECGPFDETRASEPKGDVAFIDNRSGCRFCITNIFQGQNEATDIYDPDRNGWRDRIRVQPGFYIIRYTVNHYYKIEPVSRGDLVCIRRGHTYRVEDKACYSIWDPSCRGRHYRATSWIRDVTTGEIVAGEYWNP